MLGLGMPSASAVPHLVVHAGPHKTGTTYIQERVWSCATRLQAAHGVLSLVPTQPTRHALTNKSQLQRINHNFPSVVRDDVLHVKAAILASPSRNFYGQFYDVEAAEATWAQLRACERRESDRGTPCVALISSEVFAEWPGRVWEHFLRQLSGWRVSVVLMHRAYPSLIRSSVAEQGDAYHGQPFAISTFSELARTSSSADPQLGLLDRLDAAFRAACRVGANNATGPTECRVIGKSYDDLVARGIDLYDYVALGATLGLPDAALSPAAHRLNCSGSSSDASHSAAPRVNQSPGDAFISQAVVRLLIGLHRMRGCTTHPRFYANSAPVHDVVASADFPTVCVDLGALFRQRVHRWFARVIAPHARAPASAFGSEPLCDIDEARMLPHHWAAVAKLLGPCKPAYDRANLP